VSNSVDDYMKGCQVHGLPIGSVHVTDVGSVHVMLIGFSPAECISIRIVATLGYE
jgi:hypothetical protein